MDIEKNILATRIYQMRKELNLTQEELAFKLGLAGKSSIANYESGKITPSDDIKLKMCEIFNCSMDYLMGNSKYKNENEYIKLNELATNKMYDDSLSTNDKKIINEILNEMRINRITDGYEQFIENKVNETNSKIKDVLIIIITKYYNKYYPPECETEINVFKNSNSNKVDINDMDIAFSSGIKGLNKENQEVLKNIMEGLLAKQEKDKQENKD